jgi:hypothetical protein
MRDTLQNACANCILHYRGMRHKVALVGFHFKNDYSVT